MLTNIAGASGKVNCFEADLILTNHTRSTLVVAEISVSLILLAGAALLIRTLMALHTVDAGFDADNVLTIEMSLNEPRFAKTADVVRLIRHAERRVQNTP